MKQCVNAKETMKKILMIEDEAQTRNLFLESLEAEGFYTIGAENGLVGVQRAQDELPDLVICDIGMPQLDGYGVLSRLRQDPSSAIIPFIFLSGKVTQADIRLGMELGADDYLTKPCTVEQLLRAIAARLEKQAALKRWWAFESDQVPDLPLTNTEKPVAPQPILPSTPTPLLSEVFNFIETNYHQSITLHNVAKAVGYSPAYLTDLVKRQTGQPGCSAGL